MCGEFTDRVLEIAKGQANVYEGTGQLDHSNQVLFDIVSDEIREVIYPPDIEKHLLIRVDLIKGFLVKYLKKFNYGITQKPIFNLYDYSNVSNSNEFVFSKNKNSTTSLCPNLYGMIGYNNLAGVGTVDNTPFSVKQNVGVFIGATTGDTNVKNNNRLKLANRYQDSDVCKIYIDTIIQVINQELYEEYPNYSKFFLNRKVSILEQYKYKYLIDIDGNTTSWDRLKWIFKSNSICLKQKSENVEWYYPLLDDQLIFFDEGDCLDTIIRDLNTKSIDDIGFFEDMIQKAKSFERDILNADSHGFYFMNVLKNLK